MLDSSLIEWGVSPSGYNPVALLERRWWIWIFFVQKAEPPEEAG